MTPFEVALTFTLEIESGGDPEGGFNDRPTDRGGATRWGISQRAHPDVDVGNLTRDQAIEIYREWYWTSSKCEKLPAPLAAAHFDCAANSGPWQAGKLLQRAVGAVVDGWVGPRTLEAVRVAGWVAMLTWDTVARTITAEAWSPVLERAEPHTTGYTNRGGTYQWDCEPFGCSDPPPPLLPPQLL